MPKAELTKGDVKYTIETQRDFFPMFFYNGDDLVEISLVESEVTEDGFKMNAGTVLESAPSEVTRVVYEGPVGCFEAYVDLRQGDRMAVVEGTASPWYPCNR